MTSSKYVQKHLCYILLNAVYHSRSHRKEDFRHLMTIWQCFLEYGPQKTMNARTFGAFAWLKIDNFVGGISFLEKTGQDDIHHCIMCLNPKTTIFYVKVGYIAKSNSRPFQKCNFFYQGIIL
jgi:hypothetical protein